MTPGIIICILLIAVLGTVTFVCIAKDEPIAAVTFFCFTAILGILLFFDIKEYRKSNEDDDNVISAVVYDVSKFQIDTNVVITETDTTKTYTITYWREKE